MKKANRTCVVIAGMHRSGTSALARVLNFLGCELPANVMAANPTNETGHWESDPIVALNDILLESAGSSWDDCTPCTPGWFESPRAEEFRERCADAFDSEFGAAKLCVFKDPRNCRLLPFWLSVIEDKGIEPLVILPIRNPLAVSDSLAKRNSSDPFYNQHLWLRHILDAERGSRGKRRFFCGYDDLIESWSSVISKSEKELSFKWPRFSPKASEEIDQYIASRHRHHLFSPKAVLEDANISQWLRTTYQIMLNWVADGENKKDYAKLDEIASAFDQSCTAFGRILYRGRQAHSDAVQLRDTLGQRDRALGEAGQQVSNSEAELASLRQSLADANQDRDARGHRIGELEAAFHTAQTQLTAVLHDQQSQNEQVLTLQSELNTGREHQGALHQELAQARTKDQLLEERVAQHVAELNASQSIAAQLHDQVTNSAAEIETLTVLLHQARLDRQEAAVVQESMESRCAEHERFIASLQSEHESLISALAHGDAQIAQANQSLTELSGQLAHRDLELREGQFRLIALQQEKDDEKTAFDHERSALTRDFLATEASKDETIIGLQAQIGVFANDMARAQDELSQARDQAAQMEIRSNHEMAELRAHIDVFSELVATLRADNATTTEHRHNLEMQISQNAVELDDALLKLARHEARAAEMASSHVIELETLKDELANTQAIIEGLKAHIGLLMSDLQAATDGKADLEANLQVLSNQAQEDVTRMQDAHEAQQIIIGELEQALANNQHDLTNALKESTTAQAIIEGLKAHIGLLMSDLQAATDGKADLEANLQALSDQAQEDVTRMQDAHEAQQIIIGELEQALAQTRLSLADTLKESSTAQAITEGLKAHIGLLMSDVDSAASTNAELEARLTELATKMGHDLETEKTAHQDAMAQIAAISAHRDQVEQDHITAMAALQDLEAALADTQSNLSAREAALQTLQQAEARSVAIIEGLKQHVHLLINDVDTHKAEIEAEKTNQSALWRIIDQVQADLATAQDKDAQAQLKMQALESAMTQTNSALRQRQAETDDLHKELKSAKEALLAEQMKAQTLSKDKAGTTAHMDARITQLEQDLAQRKQEIAQREQEITLSTAAIDALQTKLARQAREHQGALRDKESVALAMVGTATQTTQRLRSQVNALVRGLGEEKHAYFTRKSDAIKRKAALLVASGVIDVDWYRAVYTDVAASGVDAGVHYLTAGMAEGRASSSS